MSPESITFRQKRRMKNARNKYMNPGALVQLSCSRTTARSCADVGMKVVILESKEEIDKLHQNEVIRESIPTVSPVGVYLQPTTEVSKQQKQPQTPKAQHAVDSDGLSRLESLPMDLLVCVGNNLFLIHFLTFVIYVNFFICCYGMTDDFISFLF